MHDQTNIELLALFHKNIDYIFIGASVLVLWLLRILGGRAIAQYVTRDQLYATLREHSERVKIERRKEMKAFEDHLVLRIEEIIKHDR